MNDIEQKQNIKRIFELQSQHQAIVKASDAATRIERLERLRIAVQSHFSEAIEALNADLAKPPFEAVMDIGAVFSEIDIVGANLAQWMQTVEVPTGPYAAPGANARIMYEPRGRILIFGPWNFPFGLSLQPLVGAIAAGNTVVLKPSEMAPTTSAILAKILRSVFREEEVAVVEGGADIAGELLDLPFDHIFFTGSTRVGKRVLTAAGQHLSSVTLELGGKCPAVIGEEADIPSAAARISWGKYLNAGQICLAPDHVWVKPALRDAFVAEVLKYIDHSYYQNGAMNTLDFAKIIDERNLARIIGLLDDAVARGAHIMCGGKSQGLRLEPTVLTDVPRDCELMREEIFGPIMPILTYTDTDDLIAQINSRDKPLALYIFSNQPEFAESIISRTSSGGVTINDVLQHASDMNLPFGGVGASGMGAYHGVHSFREMSHARSIYSQAAVNPMEGFIRPPYGDRMPG